MISNLLYLMARVEFLRDRLKSLYSSLLTAAEYEKSWGKKVKQIFQDVSNQNMENDKASSKQFSQNAEIGELRRELVKAQNEMALANEREGKIRKQLEADLKQKADLIKDIEEIRKHKVDMLEPALISSTKEIKVLN